MIKIIKTNTLKVKIYENCNELGADAAKDIIDAISRILTIKDECNIIFAAAPSHKEMFNYIKDSTDVDWTKVNAFQMDEYIDVKSNSSQTLGNFLKRSIFSQVPFKSVNYINSMDDNHEKECSRYTKLLNEFPADIVCIDIGDDGHIAFNAPNCTDFEDSVPVKVVTLDPIYRSQQVNDGFFDNINEVPYRGITLSIPMLTLCKDFFCLAPTTSKAKAVYETLIGPISPQCPASILRKQNSAILYLDIESAEFL